jgi:hypothetical protein
VRERQLRRARELVGPEPTELGKVVAGRGLALGAGSPREAEHDPAVVWLEPEPEELERLDLQRSLFSHFSPERVEWMLVFVQEPSGQVPKTHRRIERSSAEEDAAALVEADRFGAGNGIRVRNVAAGSAFRAVFELLDSLAANRTEAPGVERTHGEDLARSAADRGAERVSPRAAGATQHELSRIGLLATLSGETLVRLAQRMTREDIPAGAGVVQEGESGERFYVVLSGMLTVSQRSRGAQSVLRPGDYFGEVALAMQMPRTASVRALTPVTVASCDRETFDEFVRPLFADDA